MSDKDDLVVRIEVPEAALVLAPLFGPQDQHRRMIERRLGVKIGARGTQVQVRGFPETLGGRTLAGTLN